MAVPLRASPTLPAGVVDPRQRGDEHAAWDGRACPWRRAGRGSMHEGARSMMPKEVAGRRRAGPWLNVRRCTLNVRPGLSLWAVQ